MFLLFVQGSMCRAKDDFTIIFTVAFIHNNITVSALAFPGIEELSEPITHEVKIKHYLYISIKYYLWTQLPLPIIRHL